MAVIVKDRVVSAKNFKNAKIEIIHKNEGSTNSVRKKTGILEKRTEIFEVYINGIKQNINNDIKTDLISVLSKIQ